MKKQLTFPLLFFVLSGCSPHGFESVSKIAANTSQDMACKSARFEEKFWDRMKEHLIQEKSVLVASDLNAAFSTSLDKLLQENPQASEEALSQLKSQISSLLDLILTEGPSGERVQTPEELLILLSALDVGDRSTPFRRYLQGKVRRQFSEIQKTVQSLDLNCGQTNDDTAENISAEDENDVVTSPVDETPKEFNPTAHNFEYHKMQAESAGVPLAAFGGRWTVATAYQSCQSMELPAMNDSSPDLEGVKVVGKHKDGVGNKREIASLSKVIRTHYYLRDVSSYGSECVDIRKNPLIYDYGGKPYGTTSSKSLINLFKNNGSGTKALGIDCSAYVYTSLASVGLRLKKGRNLKASDSWAWGSSSYVEPQENGLTCLDKISVTPSQSLKAGDVVAVHGHVLLIDKVGLDPFGIEKVGSSSGCSKITSDQFDFVVGQSSPSKSAIGINYFEAKDYLPTSTKMRTGLEKYAYYACLAKFNKKDYSPNLGTLSVVRHKGTSECRATRVGLTQESCIATCDRLLR